VTIFTDAQAAIRRMTSDGPGPSQVHTLDARKRIATLHQRESAVTIELRWHPVQKGVPGKEKADGWAKLVADGPDAHGVESIGYGDPYGEDASRPGPSPTWGARSPRPSGRRQRCGRTSKPPTGSTGTAGRRDRRVSSRPNANKRLASRFYLLKTGHCLTRRYLEWTKSTAKCR
jgi:hypothetical protein